MKKTFLAVLIAISGLAAFSQSEKFIKAMEPKVVALDTTHNVEGLQDLANAFERIADAEKNQWLPYYYAALANINLGNTLMAKAGGMGGNATELDPVADKAEELLSKAEALSKDNSEIYIIKKMIATLRMMGDPMSRYMTQLPIATEALATAKKINPENPRIYVLEGMDKYFTPEQFGGSKEEAKKLFDEAMKKFETFKPESGIHPNWGKQQTQFFMSQIK
jgi:hypothetical protein